MGTYIQSPIVREKVGVGTLPANVRSTSRAECMGNSFWSEGVGGHFVEAAVPGDVGLERVDHEIALDGADGALYA